MQTVSYATSPQLTKLSSSLPANPNRSTLIHQLVHSFDLLDTDDEGDGQNRARVVTPLKVGRRELGRAHDLDYVDFLLNPSTSLDDTPNSDSSQSSDSPPSSPTSSPTGPQAKRQKLNPTSRTLWKRERYNLTDDSPPFTDLNKYVLALAGATLAVAKEVSERRADVGICWDGGRHHAMRSAASGFCYINDVTLCLLSLSTTRIVQPSPLTARKPRILYLDLDIHHGDGPASAFHSPSARTKPPQVLTLSIHHASPGFFPPGPRAQLTEPDALDPYTLSVPLAVGTSGASMGTVWRSAVERVKVGWKPDYVVVCLGVDGLAGDPKGVWNLGLREEGGLGWCVREILGWELPTVLLGGGGYHHANAARAYAYFTSLALQRPFDADTPLPDDAFDQEADFDAFQPVFDMHVPLGNMKDENSSAYLDEVDRTFKILAERVQTARLKAES